MGYNDVYLFEEIRVNTESAFREIADAETLSGRPAGCVKLMAVTKTRPVSYIEAAVQNGIRHIGENKISEGGRKIKQLGRDYAVFHAIGVLHKKEVRQAVRDFHWLDAVHRLDILEEIARRGKRSGILLEVNTSGEPNKMGFPLDIGVLVSVLEKALELEVSVAGFLTVGPLSRDTATQRKAFAALREMRDALEKRMNVSLPELSMGMSDDFVSAVLEGSTTVRLGRRLFGSRNG